jgi:predicted NBD/HSP70 family sugar kinase
MTEVAESGANGVASRPSLLRELNEQAVLETIFRDGPITRPEIAAVTNLSKPTVSALVSRLEHARLVHAVGARQGQRGRKPMAYVVSDRAGFVVGVDVGGTNLRAGAADLYGEVICERQEPTSTGGARAVAEQMTEMVGEVVQAAQSTHQRLLALGISTPGVVDQRSRRVTSLAYNVSPDGGFDPLGAIGRRFEVPLLVDNNVNLAAVGEKWGGLARGVSTFAYVSVGAGVGMGIVIDDELVRGAHGAAGEICYLPTGSDPFDERHRLHGGLEDEIGAAGILAAWQGRGGPAPTSAREVFELARAGDDGAREIVDNVARHIGVAIATVCAVIDPELVVLGGGIGSNTALLAPVRATAAALLPLTTRIETSVLGDKAALKGATAVALREARRQVFSTAARSRLAAGNPR